MLIPRGEHNCCWLDVIQRLTRILDNVQQYLDQAILVAPCFGQRWIVLALKNNVLPKAVAGYGFNPDQTSCRLTASISVWTLLEKKSN